MELRIKKGFTKRRRSLGESGRKRKGRRLWDMVTNTEQTTESSHSGGLT